MRKEYLELGRVNNTHGIRGEVKFECWSDTPEFPRVKSLFPGEGGEGGYGVVSVRKGSGTFLLTLEGIDSPEKAAALKGKVLYAKREELDPENRKVFIAELEGTNVTDEATGEVYGTVTGITDKGAGTLFIVRIGGAEGRREVYLPMIKEFIKATDPERGITVSVPEGMFD